MTDPVAVEMLRQIKDYIMATNGDRMKPGDLVRLRSGGPTMTVTAVNDEGTGVATMWFQEDPCFASGYGTPRRTEDWIPMAALETVESAK